MFKTTNNLSSNPSRSRIGRRALLAGLAAGLGCLWLHAMPAQAADSQAAAAQQFIQQTGTQLVQVINGGESATQRTAELQQIVDKAVNVDNVARFCLGRYVRSVTPQQMTEFVSLFRRSLAVNISSKMGDYKGVSFKITRTETRGGNIDVETLVTRPNSAPNMVQWVVSFQTGQPQVIDLIAEGTSLRLTQRSDYASFLAHNSNDVAKLIAALRHQVNG